MADRMGVAGVVLLIIYSKTCLKRPLKKKTKMGFKTDYRLMQVKSIAECSKRAFCNTFDLHLATICFKTCVLFIFEWPLKTGFTVFELFTEICMRSVTKLCIRGMILKF